MLGIRVATGSQAGTLVPIGSALVIGREAPPPGNLSSDSTLSRQHARIRPGAERVDDAEQPEERDEAVQDLPARDADPRAGVVGQRQRREAVAAEDAKAALARLK